MASAAESQQWPYRSKSVLLVPYPSTVLREEFLCSVYFRLRSESILSRTFPGADMSTLDKFVGQMHKVPGFVIPCRKDGETLVPIGGGWLCELDNFARKGAFGFWFWKEAWGKPENVDGSMLMLRYWFTFFGLRTLYATTLRTNRLALKYSNQFGFRYIGELPEFWGSKNGPLDAELIVLRAEEFEPIFQSWSSERQLLTTP
jgi:RimJ/RimL family protein N-acetyltransferase